MIHRYQSKMQDVTCPTKMKEAHLSCRLLPGCYGQHVCVTASAPQRCAKHLLLCGEEGRGEDNGRCPPSDGVGKQRRQIRSMESELLHSNRIRRKEARVEIRSWDQWAHEKAGQRSWSQQRNSLGLVVSEKEPRTQRRASLQESK